MYLSIYVMRMQNRAERPFYDEEMCRLAMAKHMKNESVIGKLKSFFSKYMVSKRAVILIFALYFIIGMLIFDDYGFNVDEGSQRKHSIVNYVHLFGDIMRRSEHESVRKVAENAEPLATYVSPNYGVALQVIPVLVEHLFNFVPIVLLGPAMSLFGPTSRRKRLRSADRPNPQTPNRSKTLTHAPHSRQPPAQQMNPVLSPGEFVPEHKDWPHIHPLIRRHSATMGVRPFRAALYLPPKQSELNVAINLGI